MIFLVLLLEGSGALAEDPVITRLEAEVDANTKAGTAIRFPQGMYPPPNRGGWFAIRSGNEAGIVSLDENSGTLAIKDSDRLGSPPPQDITLVVEHGQPSDADQKSARWNFFLAAGLSEREICRQLGLVKQYKITLKIKEAEKAPAVRAALPPAVASPAPARSADVSDRPSETPVRRFASWDDFLSWIGLDADALAERLAQAQARSNEEASQEPVSPKPPRQTAEPEPLAAADASAEEQPAAPVRSSDPLDLSLGSLRPSWLFPVMMWLAVCLTYLFYHRHRSRLAFDEEDTAPPPQPAQEQKAEPKRSEPKTKRLQPETKEHRNTPPKTEVNRPPEETDQPREPASSSEQDLDQILGNLDDEYGSTGATAETPEPFEADDEQEDSAEAKESNEISDYMNELLTRYSNDPGSSSTAVETQESATKVRPAVEGQAAKKIPDPVCSYDQESTRSQLEMLRQTSNLTATRAIREASTRRRRRRVIRCGQCAVALGIIYKVATLLLG